MYVGIFFVINGRLALHKCSLETAEANKDFANYPLSDMDICTIMIKLRKTLTFFHVAELFTERVIVNI